MGELGYRVELHQVDIFGKNAIEEVKKFGCESQKNGYEIINIETIKSIKKDSGIYVRDDTYRIWYKKKIYL